MTFQEVTLVFLGAALSASPMGLGLYAYWTLRDMADETGQHYGGIALVSGVISTLIVAAIFAVTFL